MRNVDEDFVILSKKANDILKNFYKTTRRIFNVDLCSNCCSQKSKIPTKKKTKNLLINSLILDGNYRRKFIGSVTLNSPLQSLPASKHSFSQEPTLSEDKLIKKNIICGSIIIDGKLVNQIGGICKDRLHILHKIPYSERIKNILPCNCYCTEENKEENETDNKIDKLKCQQCFDDINPSLKNFFLANEVKKNIEEQTFERIDHTTCIQRFYTDDKKNVEKKKETCMKCLNFPDKCKRNPLEEILKFVEEDQIKLYKNNIKFSIRGLKQIPDNETSCKPVISNIILCTPKIITPISSKSDLTLYSSLSKSNNVAEIKLNDVKNEGEKLSGKEKIAKIIKDNKNKVKEEMMELYKKLEELDNIKNKLNKNLEIIKSDPAIKDLDSSVIKKRSKKQIAGKNVKMKKKDIKLKEIDNKANSEKFDEENLEIIETDSKNVIKKQNADVKNKIKMEKKLMSEETGDTDAYSEASEEDKENSDFDKNIINEVKKDGDLSKHNNNLITLMKIALKEMANENFLLAKLPDCDKLPQLRMWIKCRKGFVSPHLEKDELRDKIQNIGNEQFDETSKIVAPQIKLDKYLETLNYNDINKLENLVEMKKKLFYSKVRKSRVNVSRSAWNQLQFDNCTSDLLFKRSYFIYQPAKEADGFILKPYGLQSSKKKKKNKKSN
ncbi:GSCOCG00010959001-RA-CDS [Cotesia congregata]|nr:GSCOCG00010959001-RA-CDS [Cotesia congregata]